MNRKSILNLVVFLVFASCSSSPKNSHHQKKNLYSDIIQPDYAKTDTLHIPVGKRRPVKMSKLFSSIHYLPLQSKKGKLIGRIRKIIFTGGKIFIFDRSRPAVFIYGSDGHFINMISIPKGGGPKELVRPTDMVVDSSQISVLGTERINTYNYAGNVVKDLRLHTIPEALTVLPNGDIVLYMNNYLYSGNSYGNPGYNLLFISKDGTFEKEALPIPKKWALLGLVISNNFPSYDRHQLFFGSIGHYIYEISADSVLARYYLDFGKYNVPEFMYQDRKQINRGVQFEKKVLKKGYVYLLDTFLETNDIIHFHIGYKSFRSWGLQVFYSKRTGKTLVASKLINNIDYGPAPHFWFHKGNQLVMFVQPSDLIKKAKAIKKELTPEQLKQYRHRPQNLIDLTKNMTPMDNPVLLFCKVKSTF